MTTKTAAHNGNEGAGCFRAIVIKPRFLSSERGKDGGGGGGGGGVHRRKEGGINKRSYH